MPHDVSTRWNSTFDMLDFAINYRKAIDAMTDKRKLGLGEYELDDHEWTLAMQLRDVLKVSDMSHITQAVTDQVVRTDPQACHSILLTRDSKPCYGHPRDGPY